MALKQNSIVKAFRHLMFVFACGMLIFSSYLHLWAQPMPSESHSENLTNEEQIMKKLYVSQKRGDNSNPGSMEKPFGTIDGARDYLRTISKSMDSDVHVMIEGGIYELEKPIVFGSEDGGKNGHTITYKAMDGQKVLISGGYKVRDWKSEAGSPILSTKVPKTAGDILGQFYASGKLRPVATSGYRYNLLPRGGEAFRSEKRLMAPASIFEGIDDPKGLFMNFFILYMQFRLPIASVTIEDETAVVMISEDYPLHRMLPEGPWTPAINEEQKFAFVNHRKFLDSPGEWFFDREERVLYYYPESDENVSSLDAFIPVHEQIVIISGDNPANPVKGLRLEGLTISHSNYSNPMEVGYLSSHSDYIEWPDEDERTIPAAIKIENAEDIAIMNCELSQFGGSGVGIRKGTRDISVVNNLIRRVGATGISVGYLFRGLENINPDAVYFPNGGYWVDAVYHNENFEAYPDKENVPIDVVIKSNIVEDAGIDFGTNNGILLTHVKRARVLNNFVHNVGYCGIAVCTDHFWNPKYEDGNENVGDHVISGNLVVGTGRVLHDGAPIYLLYRNSGENLITRNCVLIDKLGRSGNNCAVYLDEGCTNYIVTQNVIDVPHNMNHGWTYVNQREAKKPRKLKAYNNYVKNNDYVHKEFKFSETIDGIIRSDEFQIYVHDNHYQNNVQEWPAEAKKVISETGPEEIRYQAYEKVIGDYKELLMTKEEKRTPGFYESYKFRSGNNIIANGDLESGIVHPWSTQGCFIQIVDSDAYEGTNCLEVTHRRFNFSGPVILFDHSMVKDMTPGKYQLSFAVKTLGEMEVNPYFLIQTRNGENYRASTVTPVIRPGDGWVYYSEEMEISWEGDMRLLQFLVGATADSHDRLAGFYLDKVELTKID